MTLPSAVAPPLSTTAANRRAGAVCLVAGVLGAGSGLYLAVAEPRVRQPVQRPAHVAGFVAIQLWFCVQHLGLLAGQVALRSSGVAGPGRAVAWGHGLGIAGMALLTLTEPLAIAAADDPYPAASPTSSTRCTASPASPSVWAWSSSGRRSAGSARGPAGARGCPGAGRLGVRPDDSGDHGRVPAGPTSPSPPGCCSTPPWAGPWPPSRRRAKRPLTLDRSELSAS